jgi:hypothetical protein
LEDVSSSLPYSYHVRFLPGSLFAGKNTMDVLEIVLFLAV